MQMAIDGVIRNFPVRPVAWVMRLLVFPFGRREVPPSDRLGRRVAALITAPNEARDALLRGIYLTPAPNNPVGRMHALLPDVVAAEPVERKFLQGAERRRDHGARLFRAIAPGRGVRGDRRDRARATRAPAARHRGIHQRGRFRSRGIARGGAARQRCAVFAARGLRKPAVTRTAAMDGRYQYRFRAKESGLDRRLRTAISEDRTDGPRDGAGGLR